MMSIPPKPLETSWKEERPNIAWIKHAIWLVVVGFVGVAIYALCAGRPLIRQQNTLSTALVAVLSLYFLKDRPRLSAWLVLAAVWWELTLAVYAVGTFFDAALFVYPLLVSAGGLLVGSRGGIILGLVSVAGVTAAGFLGGVTLDGLAADHGKEGFWLFVSVICMLGSSVLIRAAMHSYAGVLSASESDRRRYLELFEHMPQGLIGLDPQGRVLEANGAALQQLGLNRAHLLGRPIAETLTRLGLGPNFDLHQACALRQAIELPMAIRAGGGAVVLELSVQATQVPEEPTLLMLRDITQRLLIEQHLGHAQRLEAVGQLAGGIAHDFNNLLTAIGGGAEMIALDGDQASKELAQQILQAQRRGCNLTQQLLAFARRDVHQPKAIDLAATVAGMAGIVERLLGKQHQLQMARTEPVWIEADEAQVEQLVLNLVTNACDAMPRGGRVTVTVRLVAGDEAGRLGSRLQDARQAHLAVTDTGTGIAPELQARIFEPFFTTKPRGKGTGLGLAAVQGTVAQNHGCLTLSSQVGEGSSFRIFFPAVAGPSDPSAAVAAEAAPTARGTERILVVDDEEFVLNATVRLLQHSGYDVLSATNGEEALAALARSAPFSLVLTDLAMPGMNGRELGERIRALHPNLPVLYMSGYFNDPKLSPPPAAAEAGYLAKPFTNQQLLAAVRSLLPS